jgi:hypothetical protein
MSKVLKVSEGDYRVKVPVGNSIVLDTGTLAGSVIITGDLNVQGQTTTVESLSTATTGVSSSSWTTTGVNLKLQSRSYTDTTSTGTVASSYVNVMASPTLASTNAVTITNAASLFVDAPIASTNTTITNGWAIYAGGKIRATDLVLANALPVGQGGTGATTATTARTNLGATTVGGNVFTLTNPSAITFPRFNADNTVSALDAASFRAAIGIGSGAGSVTSVSGTGTVSGLTLSGTVTSSGSLTLGGSITGFLPTAGGTMTGNIVFNAGQDFPSTGASIRPSLLLDFANSNVLDPRITFTRQSSATYFGSDGLMKTTPAGIPRFTHDPASGESLGLLIEEQRTNLLTYSEQFDNAVWNKSNVTVTENAIIAPDGTLTADKIVESTANDPHYVGQNRSLSLSTTYTATYYLKAGERTFCNITTGGDTWAFAAIYIDLSNGSIASYGGAANVNNASVVACGNGWYRCSLTATTGATGTNPRTFLVLTAVSGTMSTYTGDGTSGIYIWGAQLEQASSASSYIPTTTAQATRVADNAVMTGENFSNWYNQSEGTFYAKFNSPVLANQNSVVQQIVLTVSDNTVNNRLNIAINKLDPRGFVDATTAGVYQGFSPIQGNWRNATVLASASYKSNDLVGCGNGLLGAQDTTVIIPTVNKIDIGSFSSGFQLNGTIAKIAYYPKRLSNTTLQTMTTG